MSFLVYRLDDIKKEEISRSSYEFKLWVPTWHSLVPPSLPAKYSLWWFFHFGFIFKNRGYSAMLVYDGDTLVHSFLVVPAHFRFPFMSDNDVQFTYVRTRPEYRGRGIAYAALINAISLLKVKDRAFWYVTDEDNAASRKTAEKIGFVCCGKARRQVPLGLTFFRRLIIEQ